MKAMIFAAGLGTRLQPLTNDRPKALVEVHGKTLLQITIERLASFGFNDIIINVHHFADKVIDFVNAYPDKSIRLAVSDEREMLLDTGGGLKYASTFFDDSPFLVHNTDVLSDINLLDLYQSHQASGALATLAVRQRNTQRYLLFDNQMHLCGWENIKTGEKKLPVHSSDQLERFAFSGIQIINPALFKQLKQEGKFSIIDVYLELICTNTIAGYNHTNGRWLDVGKHESLAQAADFL